MHWYSRHMEHCFMTCWMSAFMLIKCTDSLARKHVFLMHMWSLCICSRICLCDKKVIINHLPFLAMSWIRASSCLVGQYFSAPHSSASLVCVHPLIIYLWAFAIPCPLLLPPSWPLQMCVWAHPLLCWWYAYLYSYQLFCGLNSVYNCGITANLLYTVQNPVCTTCAHSTCVHTPQCTANVEILSQHPCWSWPWTAWTVYMNSISFSGSSTHAVYPVLLPQCCCTAALEEELDGGPHYLGLPSCMQFVPSCICNKLSPRPTPDASISRCNRTSYIHLSWLPFWLSHIGLGMLHSMII